MDDLIFPAHSTKEYRSYCAGKVFAKLYFTSTPNLSNDALEYVAHTFKVKTEVFVTLFYKLGFKQEYRDLSLKSGNRLPLTKVDILERDTAMGKLQTAKDTTKQGSEFLKTETLVSEEAVFCILNIGEMTGNYGEQWVLTILVDPSVIGDMESVEPVERKVSFSFGTKGKNSRDRTLESLKGEEPIHNVTIEGTALKNGGTYYDFSEDNRSICPCGNIPEEEEETKKAPF